MARTLIVLPATVFGGAERIAFNLMQGLDPETSFLLTHQVLFKAFEPFAERCFAFDSDGCHDPHDYGFRNALRYARAIARISRALEVKTVLAFMHNGSYFLALSRALWGLRARAVGSVHGNLSGYFEQRGSPPGLGERCLIALALRGCETLVVPSEGIAEDLRNHFGAASRKIQVIPNGVDLEAVRHRALEASGHEAFDTSRVPLILSASRLSPQKDYSTLLKAFHRIKDQTPALLALLGAGEMEAELRARVLDLGLQDRVLFLGFQPNPYAFMARSTVMVLSSFYEGAPVSILEGLALGVPQVCTDCPSGPSELLETEKNGFLVQIGDDEAMADRLLILLQNERLRLGMKTSAMTRANTFSLPRMLSRYRALLGDPGKD